MIIVENIPVWGVPVTREMMNEWIRPMEIELLGCLFSLGINHPAIASRGSDILSEVFCYL